MDLGVIIFGSVQFLPIKITAPKFLKIQKKNRNELKPIQIDRFRFGYFRTKTKTQPTSFGLVWFGLVRFGYFILKKKL